MHPQYALKVDGSTRGLNENDRTILEWPAVSGKPGTQGPEYQSYRDNGPFPQGDYSVKVSEMQRFEDTSLLDRLKGLANRGTFPGGQTAWGNYRFWLTPHPHTKTLGRDNFAIHGGTYPGSAGCIDLTDEMDDFADLMQALGQDKIDVRVDYGWGGAPNHRPR
ncbi:MAG: L,D-transpeptidase [Dongiaceae bacterium]